MHEYTIESKFDWNGTSYSTLWDQGQNRFPGALVRVPDSGDPKLPVVGQLAGDCQLLGGE